MKPATFLIVLCFAPATLGQKPAEKSFPSTGEIVPELKGFDEIVIKLLKKHHLPGAALAVTKDGRLVYARGFGFADREKETPMQPDSLFRLASNSKPFTAACILQLVDQGKLKLTDKVFPLLKLQPALESGKQFDPRWKTITVKHLLDHKGGFDYEKFGDPIYMPFRIADALKVDSPPRPEHIIRFMLGQTLDFDPGSETHYSNFGYLILGRVIEAATKEKYEDYVRDNVLKPIGITRMRIGRTLEADRFPDEVKYYELGWGPARSVFNKNKVENVPPPYGAWCVETMDSHGGWIASPIEMTRFLTALGNPDKFPALRGKNMQAHFEAGMYHTGRLDGSSTKWLWLDQGNVTYAVMFNGTRRVTVKDDISPVAFLSPEMRRVISSVKTWPKEDLFPKFLKEDNPKNKNP